MRNIILSSVLVASAFAISSCSNELNKELAIAQQCNADDNLCSYELVNETVSSTKTLLGKTLHRVLKKEPLTSLQGTFVWTAANANLATTASLESAGLPGCAGATCTDSENPTGFTFTAAGANEVSISGTVIINGVETSLASVPAITTDTVVIPVASGDIVITNVPSSVYNANVTGAGTTIVTKGGQSSIGITCPSGYSIYPVSSKGTYDYAEVQDSVVVKNDAALTTGQIWSTFVRLKNAGESSTISKSDNQMFGPVGSRSLEQSSIVSQGGGSILDFYCLGPAGVTWSV